MVLSNRCMGVSDYTAVFLFFINYLFRVVGLITDRGSSLVPRFADSGRLVPFYSIDLIFFQQFQQGLFGDAKFHVIHKIVFCIRAGNKPVIYISALLYRYGIAFYLAYFHKIVLCFIAAVVSHGIDIASPGIEYKSPFFLLGVLVGNHDPGYQASDKDEACVQVERLACLLFVLVLQGIDPGSPSAIVALHGRGAVTDGPEGYPEEMEITMVDSDVHVECTAMRAFMLVLGIALDAQSPLAVDDKHRLGVGFRLITGMAGR